MMIKRHSPLDILMLITTALAICWIVILFLIKHYAPSPRLPLPPLKGSPEAVALVTNNWDKFLNLCPGLSKYQEALTFVNLNERLDPEWFTESWERGVDVNFKVSDNPDLTPIEFIVRRHTCQYFISADGSELTIYKSMCASLCVDEHLDHYGYISGDL